MEPLSPLAAKGLCQLSVIAHAQEPLSPVEKAAQLTVRIRRALARRLHRLVNSVVEPPERKLRVIRPESRPGIVFMEGSLVRVKTLEEIEKTLDVGRKCRGLTFMEPMAAYCGQVLTVRKRVDRMYDEKTGKLVKLKDVVLLEGAICEGKGTFAEETCDRSCFFFFKTDWLDPFLTPPA